MPGCTWGRWPPARPRAGSAGDLATGSEAAHRGREAVGNPRTGWGSHFLRARPRSNMKANYTYDSARGRLTDADVRGAILRAWELGPSAEEAAAWLGVRVSRWRALWARRRELVPGLRHVAEVPASETRAERERRIRLQDAAGELDVSVPYLVAMLRSGELGSCSPRRLAAWKARDVARRSR